MSGTAKPPQAPIPQMEQMGVSEHCSCTHELHTRARDSKEMMWTIH